MVFASSASLVVVAALNLALSTSALPLNGTTLSARANTQCSASTEPCICGNTLGLRLGALKCPGTTFKFKNPNDPTDGTLEKVTSNLGVAGVQCDHIVELQFIAGEIPDNSNACTKFAANPAQYQQFFDTINSGNNLVDIPGTSNNAKGQLFKGNTLSSTTSKAANGLVNYLEAVTANGNTYPGTGVAQTISNALDTAVGAGNGFQAGFQGRYDTKVASVIATAKALAPKLPGFVAPGTPAGTVFCNLGPSDFRRSTTLLGRMRDWVLERRVLGISGRATKSTSASATSSCTPPPKSSSSVAASATKSVAASSVKSVAPAKTASSVVPPVKSTKPVASPVAPPAKTPVKSAKPVASPVAPPAKTPVKVAPKPIVKAPVKAPVKVTKPATKAPVKGKKL